MDLVQLLRLGNRLWYADCFHDSHSTNVCMKLVNVCSWLLFAIFYSVQFGSVLFYSVLFYSLRVERGGVELIGAERSGLEQRLVSLHILPCASLACHQSFANVVCARGNNLRVYLIYILGNYIRCVFQKVPKLNVEKRVWQDLHLCDESCRRLVHYY
jgi:hypothetical protein